MSFHENDRSTKLEADYGRKASQEEIVAALV
jgi:hypothetical protein